MYERLLTVHTLCGWKLNIKCCSLAHILSGDGLSIFLSGKMIEAWCVSGLRYVYSRRTRQHLNADIFSLLFQNPGQDYTCVYRIIVTWQSNFWLSRWMELLYAAAVQMTHCTMENYHNIHCIQYVKVGQIKALMLGKEDKGSMQHSRQLQQQQYSSRAELMVSLLRFNLHWTRKQLSNCQQDFLVWIQH